MANRQDANDFLTADRITKEQLRGIATAFNIVTLSRATRQDIADSIVEDTLGFRLSHDAIGRARG